MEKIILVAVCILGIVTLVNSLKIKNLCNENIGMKEEITYLRREIKLLDNLIEGLVISFKELNDKLSNTEARLKVLENDIKEEKSKNASLERSSYIKDKNINKILNSYDERHIKIINNNKDLVEVIKEILQSEDTFNIDDKIKLLNDRIHKLELTEFEIKRNQRELSKFIRGEICVEKMKAID